LSIGSSKFAKIASYPSIRIFSRPILFYKRESFARLLLHLNAESVLEATNHNMVVVAVIGGTGSVGKTIVEALIVDGTHETIVLGRKVRTL
jgi:hypothetical protein